MQSTISKLVNLITEFAPSSLNSSFAKSYSIKSSQVFLSTKSDHHCISEKNTIPKKSSGNILSPEPNGQQDVCLDIPLSSVEKLEFPPLRINYKYSFLLIENDFKNQKDQN